MAIRLNPVLKEVDLQHMQSAVVYIIYMRKRSPIHLLVRLILFTLRKASPLYLWLARFKAYAAMQI